MQVSTSTTYEIVTSSTVAGLQDRVRELIGTGLRPIGGIAMLHEEDAGENKPHIVFAQALYTDQA